MPICLLRVTITLKRDRSKRSISITFSASNQLTPMPVVQPVPAGFVSVMPILRQSIPAPEIAHT